MVDLKESSNALVGAFLRAFSNAGAPPVHIQFEGNVAIRNGTEITLTCYVADAGVVRSYFSESEARQNMRDSSQLYSLTIRRLN